MKFPSLELPRLLMVSYFERFNRHSRYTLSKGPNMGIKVFLLIAFLSLVIAALTWGKF